MPEHPYPRKQVLSLPPSAPPRPGPPSGPRSGPPYAELHARTNFSFLRGASHAEELVARAAELGYHALAVTDEATLAGVVRAHVAAKACGLKLLVGTELSLEGSPTPAQQGKAGEGGRPRLLLHARERAGYAELAKLLTLSRRRVDRVGGEKASAYDVAFDDVAAAASAHPGGLLATFVPSDRPEGDLLMAARVREVFGPAASVALELHRGPDDRARADTVARLATRLGLPLVAANDVHFHVPERRRLAAVLACIRETTTLARSGRLVFANGERHLRPRDEIASLYRDWPHAIERTVEVADMATFVLDELRYEYPEELVPPGETPASYLRALTEAGARERFPSGVPSQVRRQIEHELALVAELGYEPYFLTVHDIVRFARSRSILCQGRGSAANSAVCFCLGVTSVDPSRIDVLFERFVSRSRKEPPDIDVDFEHERREEVLQYIYDKYGRDRAGIAAEVITYRGRSAVRDVGKALGFSLDQVDRLAKNVDWDSSELARPERLREAGLAPDDATVRLLCELSQEIQGFPRHLSQHVGGMVIARGLLTELVPIQNASMPGRTFIEWDKDDLDAIGLLKVDCLSLGMLTAIRKAMDLVAGAGPSGAPRLDLATIPAEDSAVYDMLCRADAIGVFQVESRAQLNMLPRLRPRCFYDLVVEVSIVRPGPIQGGIVHPYLRRRRREEPVLPICPEADRVLHKTLGVPVFQEQAMRLAIDVAGFTPDEADALRKAMGAWRKAGSIEKFRERFVAGVEARGVPPPQAAELFERIHGFGEYGFPECVAGETRVVDAETGGWVSVEDAARGRVALRWTLSCDSELRLRKRRVRRIWSSGTKQTFRLRTALGRTIVASAEHPFMTLGGWRKVSELKVGDHVAAARALPALGRKRWPRHKTIVLADLIAEGNLCHPSTFYFYSTDALHRDEFIREVEKFENTRAVSSLHHGCFSVRVRRIDRSRLPEAVEWVRGLGLWDVDALAKHVPAEVFELRDADIGLLLARLWEGDGNVSGTGHVGYDTASRRLAEDVQHLLLRLGIVSRLYERDRPYRGRTVTAFTVTVTGSDNLRRFWRRIGRRFLTPAKRLRARAVAYATRPGKRASRDIIPTEVRSLIRSARTARGTTWTEIGRATSLGMREIQGRGEGKRGFRRWVVAELGRHLQSRGLERIAGSDLYWDRITGIEPAGPRETYDLQVEGDHNFLANDLVVHNSHAASFSLLVYASAWLKLYHPAAFTAGLLNAQPMGFYQPAQLVRDARDHGVEVRPVCVQSSGWDASLEPGPGLAPALRLGMRLVKGLRERAARTIEQARAAGPFRSLDDLVHRTKLARESLERLAEANAFVALGLERREAVFEALARMGDEPPLFASARADVSVTEAVSLPPLSEFGSVAKDYATVGLTLARHPVAHVREALFALGVRPASELREIRDGERVTTAGIVICRQRPQTASGIVFFTIEDETGTGNLIVRPDVFETFRRVARGSQFVLAQGKLERDGDVVHVLVRKLQDMSHLFRGQSVAAQSRDFR